MSSRIALYYDDSGYRETLERAERPRTGVPAGLMGRQVAGKEFLDAYLRHGTWTEMVALAPNQASVESLKQTCASHPSSRERQRRLSWVQLHEFHAAFQHAPPADVLYFPCPPDARFAWTRQHLGGHPYAVCGVTHTLCSASLVQGLRELVTAAYEPYDRLICTSRAVLDMVLAVTDSYSEYLRERFGGQAARRIGLETIPLGVDTQKFAPASPQQRAAERQRLQIDEDEVTVLFVGRLAHHAKAHPFPMYRGVAQAAARAGCRVRLLMSGWAASPAVLAAFQDGAAAFADNVQVQFVDGMDPAVRFAVWRAADVFISLSDNIQETFGLVILEAMASGLPVVATHWNGYRDLVDHGRTGFLVPTTMIRGATEDVTSRLLLGEVNYDHFLAETSQAVAVDVAATAEALGRLLEDPQLRQRMGQAGRERAVQRFDWSHVVRAYEALWQQQQVELRSAAARPAADRQRPWLSGSAAYPAPEHSFAGYPSRWLADDGLLLATADASARLETLLNTPLTNHESHRRCARPELLQDLLEGCGREPKPLAELIAILTAAQTPPRGARATVAWLLKYDLLRPADAR